MEWLCSQEVIRRNGGRALGVAKTTSIWVGCGRPAAYAVRGYRLRNDGSLYLAPWSARCNAHFDPGWQRWAQADEPRLIGHHITAKLEG